MKLVLLAAGHGKRFGGLKQIAPVGPEGEAIMDYTVRAAEQCGYEGVVLVVREEIREQLARHVRSRWSSMFPVEIVAQPPRPGTAYAVLCARPFIDGPFAVANADDLYEPHALDMLARHFDRSVTPGSSQPPHVLVAYELGKTVLTAAGVKRGLCEIGASGGLDSIVEHLVRRRDDGRFDATPLDRGDGQASPSTPAIGLEGRAAVSMNLWGFAQSILGRLADAVGGFEPDGPDREVLLPEIVGALVRDRVEDVKVITTTSHCYGVTHQEDVALVRRHLESSTRKPASRAEEMYG